MKNKPYIIIIIGVLIYLIGAMSFNFIKALNTSYIIFPDGTNLKYEKKFSKVDINLLPNYKFSIIQNGNLIATKKLNKSDDGIYFKNINLEENSLAYRGKDIDYILYQVEDLNDEDYLYLDNILKIKNIDIDLKSINYLVKYKIDLNNDNNDEYIYSISNNYDTDLGLLFSAVIIRSNEDIILEFDTFNSEFEAYIPYLYFVDIHKNNFGDIILKNVYSSDIGQDIRIIKFSDNLTNYEILYEEAK